MSKKKWIQKANDRMEEKGTKGSFTRAAKRAGMSVQAYANKVLKSKNASTKSKRRAAFAKRMGSISRKK